MAEILKLFSDYDILRETANTLLMVFLPVVAAYAVGLPIGVLCTFTSKDGLRPRPVLNKILNAVVNIGRSIPFIILLFLLVPFTRWLVGTSLGPWAACVPLTVSCIPFVARMTEQSIVEVEKGVVDAALMTGATDFQIVTDVYLPETLPSLIRGFAITAITLVGYTAMSGAVGARGLGYVAVKMGYERNRLALMYLCVFLLIALVGIIQLTAEILARKINKKEKPL